MATGLVQSLLYLLTASFRLLGRYFFCFRLHQDRYCSLLVCILFSTSFKFHLPHLAPHLALHLLLFHHPLQPPSSIASFASYCPLPSSFLSKQPFLTFLCLPRHDLSFGAALRLIDLQIKLLPSPPLSLLFDF